MPRFVNGYLINDTLHLSATATAAVVEEADIVCCTLSCAGSPQLLECVMNSSSAPVKQANWSSALRFDVVIIDEACQCTEPSALIPFKYNPKVTSLRYRNEHMLQMLRR